jgi:hypothetical protein
MCQFKLSFACDNAAFDGDALHEVARILRECADKIETGRTSGPVRDFNGNTVGKFELDQGAQS